ncbi:MAG: hypothetical protein LC643_00535 [Bacteroidales bacterium]|nr:hypothetical protein [Bacteroidales bacterium]
MHLHSFHIPVMGIGYTIDTPIRVAHLGISSAISLVDDMLTERMREFYASKYNLPFTGITYKMEDFRAKRITAYLNVVNAIVNQKVKEFKSNLAHKREELNKFLELLPDTAELKQRLSEIIDSASPSHIQEVIEKHFHPGTIDVNIMTKLDKENYLDGEKLPTEYNDAHAGLRGFANSDLQSSIVLSAGMNARLYTYMEQFEDFYPDAKGVSKKNIILKVSDYRSAIVQGKIFAKKGLWISEFRVESGLNCGGHAFATQGFLMGPILEEFRKNKDLLQQELFEMPEAVSIDDETMDLLAKGGEEDYFLSHVSPVGVRFNNIKGASRDLEQQEKVKAGKPGAACTKKFILLNKEFTDRPICVASRQYQKIKIEELEAKNLPPAQYDKAFRQITVKSCICNGLGVATLNAHGMDTKKEGTGVSVCPGPNLAYFNRQASLKEMVDHINGKTNLITHPNRPNLFVKELTMYQDYIDEELDEIETPDSRQLKSWNDFLNNLQEGIEYYHGLFSKDLGWSDETIANTKALLKAVQERLDQLTAKLLNIKEHALMKA